MATQYLPERVGARASRGNHCIFPSNGRHVLSRYLVAKSFSLMKTSIDKRHFYELMSPHYLDPTSASHSVRPAQSAYSERARFFSTLPQLHIRLPPSRACTDDPPQPLIVILNGCLLSAPSICCLSPIVTRNDVVFPGEEARVKDSGPALTSQTFGDSGHRHCSRH